MKNTLAICLYSLILLCCISCQPEEIISNNNLSLNKDVFIVDTMLIQKGGVVNSNIRLMNNNSIITNDVIVSLAKGNNSPFEMNVNGNPGNYHDDIKINGNDSLYIFLKVPSSRYIVGGNEYIDEVDTLQIISGAYKKSAIIRVTKVNTQEKKGIIWDDVWDGAIYLSENTVIPANHKLSIEKGSRIYCNDTISLVVNGTLLANGDCNDKVTFGTYRFDYLTSETKYTQIPNHWKGIIFSETSANNKLRHCNISNADTCLLVNTELSMMACKLEYNGAYNLLCQQSTVDIETCLFSNAKTQIKVENSTFSANFCTIANYNDWYKTGDIGYALEVLPIEAGNYIAISNSIIYGPHSTEFNIEQEDIARIDIKNSLIKSDYNIPDAINENPLFISIKEFNYNFGLMHNSPCIDIGDYNGTEPIYDIDCNAKMNKVDIGAYEYIGEKL